MNLFLKMIYCKACGIKNTIGNEFGVIIYKYCGRLVCCDCYKKICENDFGYCKKCGRLLLCISDHDICPYCVRKQKIHKYGLCVECRFDPAEYIIKNKKICFDCYRLTEIKRIYLI